MWNNKAWELGNSATTEGKYVSKLMTSQPERFLSCLHNYVNAHMWHCMIQRITMVLVIYLLHWFEFRARDWVCTWAHDYHPLEFHSLGLSKATWVITFGFVYHYTETCWPFMAICYGEFWISQTCLHNHHKSFVPVVG